ncbi:MAG: hypothetical protein R2722_01430 [Tessaracoccus sp.]
MGDGSWRRALLVGMSAAVVLTGCVGSSPTLRVPQGNAVCVQTSGPAWFGVDATNESSKPLILAGAQLDESTGAELVDVIVIPEIVESDGTTLLLGSAVDLAEDSPEQWAARKPVDGFVIEPGQTVAVALQIQRLPGVEVAEVSSQTVSYRPDGKLYNRTVTSLIELSIAEDCSAEDDDE